jgi:hypothetical protein
MNKLKQQMMNSIDQNFSGFQRKQGDKLEQLQEEEMPEDASYDAEKCWINAKAKEGLIMLDPSKLKKLALSGQLHEVSLNSYTAPIYLANLALAQSMPV